MRDIKNDTWHEKKLVKGELVDDVPANTRSERVNMYCFHDSNLNIQVAKENNFSVSSSFVLMILIICSLIREV